MNEPRMNADKRGLGSKILGINRRSSAFIRG